MATEIERTFLVIESELPKLGTPVHIEQAYLSDSPCTRIRLKTRDGCAVAFFTVKGPGLVERAEIECEFPTDKAKLILSEGLWQCALAKNRYERGAWEIDEFLGEHEGLWLAEIELKSRKEQFDLPDWLGPEVSEDPRFSNLALARDGVPDCYWKWVETGEWSP